MCQFRQNFCHRLIKVLQCNEMLCTRLNKLEKLDGTIECGSDYICQIKCICYFHDFGEPVRNWRREEKVNRRRLYNPLLSYRGVIDE